MKVVKSSDVEKEPVQVEGAKGVEIRWLISKGDGAENFAMWMFELQRGGYTPLHTHPHEHEVFVVEGQGIFVCEGQEYPFNREHVIFVPGGKEHRFKNTADGVLRFLCIIPASAI